MLAGLSWAGCWWASLVGFGQVSSFPFFLIRFLFLFSGLDSILNF
jgi:hypothetical protein